MSMILIAMWRDAIHGIEWHLIFERKEGKKNQQTSNKKQYAYMQEIVGIFHLKWNYT